MVTQKRSGKSDPSRRGAILVWSAVIMTFMLAMTAFAVDISYMTVVATQLQNAVDAAALSGVVELPQGNAVVIATVQEVASKNKATTEIVTVKAADVEFGWYDTSLRKFTTPSATVNAIRVTARVENKALFFAPVVGQKKFTMKRSAIAILNPRDIAFAVDLSGSMNDDTEPCWATNQIAAKFGPLGYPTVAADLMQKVYDDFGFGAYPGTSEVIFQSLLGTAYDPPYAYSEATKDNGVLTVAAIPVQYRILNTDDEDVRKTKAYSWLIDEQIKVVMPVAKPTPDSNNADSLAYWTKYLDYIIWQWEVGIKPPPPPPDPDDGGGGGGDGGGGGGGPSPPGGFLDPKLIPSYFDFATTPSQNWPRDLGQVASTSHLAGISMQLNAAALGDGPPGVGVPRRGSSEATYLPPDQDWRRIWSFNNPNRSTFPSADSYAEMEAACNHIGYASYVQFMMDWGRDRTPVVDDSANAVPGAGTMTPLSLASPLCPMHSESTAGGTFSFPPREQPMHAVRRALIAALQEVKTRNAGLSAGTGDKVSLVTYDGVDANHQPTIVVPLTENYASVMLAATKLQSVSDVGNTTATEPGLIKARAHIAKPSDGGMGRNYTTKVVLLCTDGVPNVWQTDAATVKAGIAAAPSSNYYAADYVWYNSVLRQAALMEKKKEKLYGVGMGLGADLDFMDRIARLAQTDEGGLSPRGTGNPSDYEQQLINIFKKVINTRSGRLVK